MGVTMVSLVVLLQESAMNDPYYICIIVVDGKKRMSTVVAWLWKKVVKYKQLESVVADDEQVVHVVQVNLLETMRWWTWKAICLVLS